jgi:hypothetical protein
VSAVFPWLTGPPGNPSDVSLVIQAISARNRGTPHYGFFNGAR